MAPKPASTGGKAPASTAASKAPAKTTEGKKAAKKTSKAPADGEKKKRRKTRKETYSSYIYKGTLSCSDGRRYRSDAPYSVETSTP
jgi:histone H2B